MDKVKLFFYSLASFLEERYYALFGKPEDNSVAIQAKYNSIKAKIAKSQTYLNIIACQVEIERFLDKYGDKVYFDYLSLKEMAAKKSTSITRRAIDLHFADTVIDNALKSA